MAFIWMLVSCFRQCSDDHRWINYCSLLFCLHTVRSFTVWTKLHRWHFYCTCFWSWYKVRVNPASGCRAAALPHQWSHSIKDEKEALRKDRSRMRTGGLVNFNTANHRVNNTGSLKKNDICKLTCLYSWFQTESYYCK